MLDPSDVPTRDELADSDRDGTTTSPLVTIVVPCRNEEDALGACLESIAAQTLADFEALIVDGCSTDASRDIVREFGSRDERFRLLDNPRRIVPAAINLGLAQARGRWLVRIDAHCTVPTDYVERLVRLLETGAGGAGGRKLGRGRTATGRAIAAAMSSRVGVGGSAYHHDGAVRSVDHIPFGAYPVELAREVGGWDERLSVNQDFEFDIRVRGAGHELVLDPSIVIDWESRQTISALFRQYRRYGRGKTRVVRLHPSSTRVRHFLPPLFVAGLVLFALPIRPRWFRRLRVATAAAYLAVIASAGWRDGRSLPLADRPKVSISLVAMHVGWGLGFWEGICDLVRRGERDIVDVERLGATGEGRP